MATFFLTTNTSTADAPAGAQVVIFPGRPGIAGFQTFTPEDGDVYIIDPLLQGNFTFNGDAAFEVNFDQAAQYSVAVGDPAPDFDSTYTFADTTDATVNVAPGADIGLAELIGEGDSLTVNVFGNATTGAISGDGLNAGGGGLIVNQIPVVDGEEFGEEMGPGYNDNNAPTDNGGDVIDGADGDEDVIFGNGGNDTIAAGAGNDTVDGGTGDDIIFGDFGDFGDGASSGGAGVIGTQLDSEERVDGDLYGRFSGTVRDGDFDFSSDAFFLGDDIGVLDGGNRNELRGQTFSQDGVGTDRVAELVDIDFTGAQKSFVGLATVQRSSLHRATDAFSASNGDGFQDVVIINDVDVTFTMNDGTVFQHIRMQFLRGEDGKTYLLADDHPQQGTFNSIRTTVFRNDSGIESFEIESSSGNINGINPIVGNWAAGQFFETVIGEGGDDTITGGDGDDLIYGDNGDSPSAGGAGVTGSLGDGPGSTGGSSDRVVNQAEFNTFDFTTDAFFLGNDIVPLDDEDPSDPANPDNDALDGQTFSLTGTDRDGNPTDRTFELDELAFENGSQSFVGVIDIDRSGLYGSNSSFTSSFASGPQNLVIVNNAIVTFTMNDGQEFINIQMKTVRDDEGNTFMVPGDGASPVAFNSFRNLLATNDSGIASFKIQHISSGQNAIIVMGGDWADGQFFSIATDGDGGDDVISGGLGTDTMFGEGGDDTFLVGSAAEGANDEIVGGNGPDQNTDNDVLDLRGAGAVTIDDVIDETDAGARTGTVTFNDGSTLTFSQIEEIITDPANDAPVAVDDAETTPEDTPITFNPAANDSDPDGDTLVVIAVDDPANGTAVVNPDGTVTYTPDADYNGPDTITYTVSDGNGGTDTATVSVTVDPVNDAPVAVDDAETTPEDTPITFNPAANDSDPDGDTLVVIAVDDPANGTAVVNPDGTVTYTPDADYNGPDTITYTVSDGNGGTDTATVSVTVDPVNDAPVAVDDAETTPEDTPITFNPAANDSDPDGDTLVVIAVDDPANGTAVVNPDGTVTYTPDADYNGPDTITYTVSDGNGGTDTATVSVTVDPANDAPVAVDDAETTPEDTPITFNPAANDSDPDGDTLVVIAVDDPANGTAVVNPDGTVTYTPDADYNGPDTITYTVSDGNGGTDTATVSVTVDPVNDAPVAVDDAETTPEDTPITFNPAANDSDPDGDTLVVIAVDDPANGTAVVNPDGTVTYTPDADYNGPDTITYTVSDGNGGTDTATVSVTVDPVNDAPVAVDDAETTPEDTPITFNPAANDSDPDGDTLVVIAVDDPANGTAVVNPDGTVTYTPDADYNGPDTITYTVSDGNGGTDTATVSVTVDPVNDAPVAVDDAETTPEDTPITFNPAANDSDPDGDTLVVIAVDDPANGTAVVNPDGTVTYTPDADYNGPDTITYTVSDGNGGTDTATVSVTVDPENDAPVAVDDAETTPEDTPITFNPAANDSDPDGDTLVVIAVDDPANGTAVVNPDGTVTYTPDADYNGPDTITYTVSDGNGGTDTATVSVTVDPVNDAPVAVDDAETTPEDTPITFNPAANDSDPDGDTLVVIAVDDPANGTAVVNPDGTVTYTPDADYNGPDTITYTVSDGNGGTDTATVSVTVDPVNLPPIIDDEFGEVCYDETVTIDLIDVNDIDPEGAPLNLVKIGDTDVSGLAAGDAITLDNGVVITLGLDGDIIVDGEGATISGEATADLLAGESAVDTFTYTLSDGTGGTATANVEVTFKGATDSIDKVIDSLSGVLGSEVCFQIQDNQDPLQGSPTATEAYSLLISDILGVDDDRFEGVTFTEAYCMSFRDDVLATDALSPIESAPLLKGNIFLADESSIPAGALTNEGFAPDFSKIPATENLDLINWILNQDFTSIDNGDGTGETYTDSEVQAAIWGLTDSSITVQSPDGGNSANAFEIIQFAWNDADRDGIDDGGAEGFIVGQDTGIFSENNNIIGLFIDPTDETEALGHSQPFLIGVDLFEDCIC